MVKKRMYSKKILILVALLFSIFTSNVIVAEDESKTLNLMYLKGEGSGEQYGVSTIEMGPDGVSAHALIDEETGDAEIFLGTNVGVQILKDNSSNLVKMKGIEGKVIGIGGQSIDELTAVVQEKVIEQMSWYYKHYIYNYDLKNDAWVRNENSYFGDMNSYQNKYTAQPISVVKSDDIWLHDIHWDGIKWNKNDIVFIDLERIDERNIYGLTELGDIYKYNIEIKKWNKLDIIGLDNGEDYINISTNKNGNMVIKSNKNIYIIRDSKAVKIKDLPKKTFNVFIDSNDNIYSFVDGEKYNKTGTAGYIATDIYILNNNKWIKMNIPEYKDIKETGEEGIKIRPNGIKRIISLPGGIDLYIGTAGANYISGAEHIISFESNGGNKVDDIKSFANKPISPKGTQKNGFKFAGWYLDKNYENKYEFETMPAKDLKLYAKWNLESKELDKEVEKAIKSLNESFSKKNKEEFNDSNWDKIISAHDIGVYKIIIAENYGEVYDSLNKAIANMDNIAPDIERDITVCVSMEKFTLGQGDIIEPTLVRVKNYEQVSKVITDLLKKKYPSIEQPWEMTGSIKSDFYLSRVYDPDRGEIKVPDYIKEKAEINYEMASKDWLGEFDYYYMSGWMYSINDSFPGVGAASWRLTDGDIVRWQYTLYGYGSDLGADNSDWGAAQIVESENKGDLMWAIAKLKQFYTKETLLKNQDYLNAFAVLQDISASQAMIDNALENLKKTKIKY